MSQRHSLVFSIALLLALPAFPACGQTPEAEALIGLWAYEADFTPALRGELTIKRVGRAWQAAIGREMAAGTNAERNLRFSFGNQGSFRGRLSVDSRTIEGFWLRPSGSTANRRDPGGSGQSFATPMRLQRTSASSWTGVVEPLQDRFTLYLKVFRDKDGSLQGAFRNPQLNSNGGASRFAVSRQRDAVHFEFKYDGGEANHDAVFVPSPDRIRIQWRDLERPIELTRRRDGEAASFYPRLPGSADYVYRVPAETGDGWRTARAGDTGLDEAALQAIIRGITSSDPTTRPPDLIHSLLVAHRGRLVLEEYFFGNDRETPHDTRSAGKTLGSVMLGTAPARLADLSPASRIYQVMKAKGPFANPDPRKAMITLGHLMTHTSGLACDDNDEKSPGNEERMQSQTAQPDWWRYTLDLPMAHDPGTRYAYCSANSNLVGAALTTATRTWLPELFRRQVAEPLQFGPWHWNLMPTGEGYLGGGAFLRPRDLLKLGQTFLDGGVWNGRRIVPADWVKQSTLPRMEITPETTGLSQEDFGNFYGGGKDAWAWHPGELKVGARNYPTYAATGNGGQVLLVVPDFDLAVVFNGGNYGQGGVWGRWGQQIVGDRIIPAIAIAN